MRISDWSSDVCSSDLNFSSSQMLDQFRHIRLQGLVKSIEPSGQFLVPFCEGGLQTPTGSNLFFVTSFIAAPFLIHCSKFAGKAQHLPKHVCHNRWGLWQSELFSQEGSSFYVGKERSEE